MFDNIGIEPWMSLESTDASSFSGTSGRSVEKGIDEIIDVCSPQEIRDDFCLFKEVEDGDIDPD
eukprot:CAMPEP_0202946678 /NCGR_PEP_ID=MMETSP1395-20130829/9796_1 /ASSEMBLY_ACC=CAM_ASM_000871 /TAXON_ID=5961 /ORGANISM="Blepharisma japonicum, Strain Stock R1072" /LENGTH=63 /DNA_ID=CAMNT_0049647421 /DNA_START=665 /DNA_END=853 /DNA_ORIENTATION=-